VTEPPLHISDGASFHVHVSAITVAPADPAEWFTVEAQDRWFVVAAVGRWCVVTAEDRWVEVGA
jgi:hypothetical protein